MMRFNINDYTKNLTEKDGVFFSQDTGKISYPADGNEICFNIEDNSFWFKHRNNCIITLVKRYADNKPFFDIGGGNGFVSQGLEENGIKTCLVEPGIQGCLNAKKRRLQNIICSDLKNAELKIETISSLGLFDVIEHVEDDGDFLNYVNKILCIGATIFITVPAYNFLWSSEDTDAGHFRRYTLQNIKKKLNDAGFETIYSTYIFSFLVFPIFFLRSLPNIFGLNKHEIEEHNIDGKEIANKLLTKFLSFEINQIEKGKNISFGSSCLIVARKIKGVI